MITTERFGELTKKEGLTLNNVLREYGYFIYQYGDETDGRFIVPCEIGSYEEMMKSNFIFLEFISESFPLIKICSKGKLYRRETVAGDPMMVLYSRDDIRIWSNATSELVLKNRSKIVLDKYSGEYKGEKWK